MLLHSICKTDGITALLSLHQVDFATAYGDRIIGLAQGQVSFDGPPSTLSQQTLDAIYGEAAPAVPMS